MSYKDCFNKPAKDWESAIMGMETSKLLNKMSEQKDTFTWTDELVNEYAFGFSEIQRSKNEFSELIDKFKQSKMQKVYPARILVFKTKTDTILLRYGVDWLKDTENSYNQFVEYGIKNNYKIWQVQNGDEILTVGDNINFPVCNFSVKISAFKIYKDNKLALETEDYGALEIPDNRIKKIDKEKTFTLSEVREKISNAARHIFNDDIYFKILKEFED